MGNSNENREIKHQSWWLWICAILGNPILAHARMWIRPPVNSVDSWLVGFFSWTLYLYSSFQCFNNEWTIHSWKSALVCFNALGQTSTLDQVLANENLQGCKVDISIYGYHLMCIPRTVAKKPVRTSDFHLTLIALSWDIQGYQQIRGMHNPLWFYGVTKHRSWEDQLEKPRTHCISLLSATFGFPWEFRISGMCPATLRFFPEHGIMPLQWCFSAVSDIKLLDPPTSNRFCHNARGYAWGYAWGSVGGFGAREEVPDISVFFCWNSDMLLV